MSDRTQADYRTLDAEPQIASIVGRWKEAWNAHDASALASLVASDVDFVNVAGRWLRGVEEFSQWHRMIHQTHLRRSRWSTRQYHQRPLGPGLVLVHLQWAIDGELDPDGNPRPQRRGVFSWLIALRDGSSRIVAAHNTNLGDGVQHRPLAHVPANAPPNI